MTSQNPSRTYDEAMLDAFEQALRDVGQVLNAHEPDRDWITDPDLRTL